MQQTSFSPVCSLTNPGESETLIYRADRYLETLLITRKKAEELLGLLNEMRAMPQKKLILHLLPTHLLPRAST